MELKDGRKLFSVTASIGVAIGRYDSPDALLRDADLALYSAKAAGKDRYELFDASMYAGAKDRVALETDLGRRSRRASCSSPTSRSSTSPRDGCAGWRRCCAGSTRNVV